MQRTQAGRENVGEGGRICDRRAGRMDESVLAHVFEHGGIRVFGLIVGLEGHAVICVLSAALRRLTHTDVFHPLSPCCTKSREGFNVELNTCRLRREAVSALHLDTLLPDTVTLCFSVAVLSVKCNQTLQL